ncbi:MAG: DUF58 domain-containing protein [Candidatus Aminicenantes bacterium]|jgi:uncharacterized protein (DUF58 family)
MMATKPAPSLSKNTDFRRSIRRSHHRQRYLWLSFLAVVILLLSVFHAGFFLYSALVVTGLLLAAMGMAATSLLGLKIRRSLANREIHLGEAVDAWLTIENQKGLPALWTFWQDHIDADLDVEGAACHYKTFTPNQSHQLKYRLHSTRRGLFRVGPTVVETSGPLGLVRRFLVGHAVDFITVLPRVVSIRKGVAQGQRPVHQVPRRRSIFEDPSRFMGMREYRPGDSMRRIHWRATARSGKIQVKLFEPSVLTGLLLAVDMGLGSYPQTRTKPRDIDPLLELTVTAAASLGEYVLAGDQRVGLISNGTDAAEQYPEDWTGGTFRRLDLALEKADLHVQTAAYQPVEIESAKGHWQYERLLSALARLLPSASIELPDLLMTELPRLPRSLVLMVVTPVISAALTGVLESLKRSGIETGIVWTRLPEQQPFLPAALPQNIPVYPITGDADLEQLGGQSL